MFEKKMNNNLKPILKWAGGKRQMLPGLIKYLPKNFNNYIEPFIGGGALFFFLNKNNSIISDTNDELINLYKEVARNPKKILKKLKEYKNTKKYFYTVRKEVPNNPTERACRTIFLNRTCFNGLYRVNKKGEFNVPYADNGSTKLTDGNNLLKTSQLLKKTILLNLSYDLVLKKYAKKNDLIFLDPPYLPVSKFSDFKRYTKEQFHLEDHKKLASIYEKLHEKGCYLILTNSNSPEILKLYKKFNIKILNTKRNINAKGNLRTGKDIIVTNYEAGNRAI
tara:strand:- start:48 stop:884 length:837 start_codon:yes stop_codon:yes gene_type:complete